ncbi:hypothetical protein HYN59_17405 [Flavobacterium album]|uniref:TonB C-terminal domain-containing protein n=1 Tax=Flavobacterium album TaxID=2175091 RepID=A0A2S1R269_9FLAO|nr:energy transducer TonB [Flavobacterium album]AWH86778.1 hypothetical protein HYN59_17405 [Flavobacterium album]
MKKIIFSISTLIFTLFTQAQENHIRISGDDIPIDASIAEPEQFEKDNKVYQLSEVEVLPEFSGGNTFLASYLDKNIRKDAFEKNYPPSCIVYVSFIIEKNGNMTNIKIERDPGYGIGKETLRVLKTIKTKWNPGVQNGKPVRVNYPLPIKIS